MIRDKFVLYSKISFLLVVHNLVLSQSQEGIHTNNSLKSWFVYVDSSAANAGPGAGVLLIDPNASTPTKSKGSGYPHRFIVGGEANEW
ncbi:hypothetical protein EPI10_027727 [Gossypium australe]|uniref:Uncharacterized protein n=1 Tax=Gossypium australe TaxID=47621 RepID=A0A5B6UWV3_9ROSI|nr:hypothetical protein EPI10_027727 [Gossypium australe]